MKDQLSTLPYHFHYYENTNTCKNTYQLQSSLHVPGIRLRALHSLSYLKYLE